MVPYPCLTKLMIIMRLSLFFLLVLAAQAWAIDSYSQNTRLSLNLRNAKVVDILAEIEENSDYYFLFNQMFVDVERKVDINVSQKKIEDILEELFAETNVNYLIMDRQIVLTTASPEVKESTVQQQGQVTGKVTDKTGTPIPGVTVIRKGTTFGIITDNNGNYMLTNVNPSTILEFSFVGMKSQDVIVGTQTIINVTMLEDVIGLDEIVAIGYGTMQKVNLTGAVTTVSSDDIARRQVGQT